MGMVPPPLVQRRRPMNGSLPPCVHPHLPPPHSPPCPTKPRSSSCLTQCLDQSECRACCDRLGVGCGAALPAAACNRRSLATAAPPPPMSTPAYPPLHSSLQSSVYRACAAEGVHDVYQVSEGCGGFYPAPPLRVCSCAVTTPRHHRAAKCTRACTHAARGRCGSLGPFQGRNACVLAYGQTGAGKSYTMFGDVVDSSRATSADARRLGVIPRAVHDLFEK